MEPSGSQSAPSSSAPQAGGTPSPFPFRVRAAPFVPKPAPSSTPAPSTPSSTPIQPSSQAPSQPQPSVSSSSSSIPQEPSQQKKPVFRSGPSQKSQHRNYNQSDSKSSFDGEGRDAIISEDQKQRSSGRGERGQNDTPRDHSGRGGRGGREENNSNNRGGRGGRAPASGRPISPPSSVQMSSSQLSPVHAPISRPVVPQKPLESEAEIRQRQLKEREQREQMAAEAEVKRQREINAQAMTLFPPALLRKIDFLPYFSISDKTVQRTIGTTRFEILTMQNNDLSSLLTMNDKSFWAHVLHDPTLRAFFDSYLRFCQRPFDLNLLPLNGVNAPSQQQVLSEEEQKLEDDLLRRVFSCLVRISSSSSSQQSGLIPSESLFGNLLSDMGIFNIPKLMDICALFGSESSKEIISTVMTSTRSFFNELQERVTPVLCKNLEEIASRRSERAAMDRRRRHELQPLSTPHSAAPSPSPVSGKGKGAAAPLAAPQQQQQPQPKKRREPSDSPYTTHLFAIESTVPPQSIEEWILFSDTVSEAMDVSLFLYDFSSTIRGFLTTCPQSAHGLNSFIDEEISLFLPPIINAKERLPSSPLHGSSPFIRCLALCYEFILPQLDSVLSSSRFTSSSLSSSSSLLHPSFVQERPLKQDSEFVQALYAIRTAKSNIIKIAATLITECYLNPISGKKSTESAHGWKLDEMAGLRSLRADVVSEQFKDLLLSLPIITSSYCGAIAEEESDEAILKNVLEKTSGLFLRDLDKWMRLSASLNGLKSVKNIDGDRLDFMLSILSNLQSQGIAIQQQQQQQAKPVVSSGSSSSAAAAATPSSASSGSSASLISQVKDIFPDFGDGFIAACLKYYSNNAEKVVSQLLEDSLPPELKRLDRKMPAQQQAQRQQPRAVTPPSSKIVVSSTPAQPAIKPRHNIFAEDSFEILAKKPEIVSFGKKAIQVSESANDSELKKSVLANTQRHLQEDEEEAAAAAAEEARLAELAARMGYLSVASKMVYEDEYDDTYEGFAIGNGGGAENDEDHDDSLRSASKKGAAKKLFGSKQVSQAAAASNASSGGQSAASSSSSSASGIPYKERKPRVEVQAEEDEEDEEESGEESSGQQQQQPHGQGQGNPARGFQHKAQNKARIGNHNRKAGHDKKMRAALAIPRT